MKVRQPRKPNELQMRLANASDNYKFNISFEFRIDPESSILCVLAKGPERCNRDAILKDIATPMKDAARNPLLGFALAGCA